MDRYEGDDRGLGRELYRASGRRLLQHRNRKSADGWPP
jgi:hypothetical protein